MEHAITLTIILLICGIVYLASSFYWLGTVKKKEIIVLEELITEVQHIRNAVDDLKRNNP
jgi:hypothetical protein